METKSVYHCMGKCQGNSPDPCKCGDTACEHWNQPLKEYHQCKDCAESREKDGKTHWCPACKPL
ncbi:hypothetical protein HY604_02755 [Candidatus Peregrinibacteria bacterium]|nr:hypothetical protein [Candidatus Peregrinibacteria bacterium]